MMHDACVPSENRDVKTSKSIEKRRPCAAHERCLPTKLLTSVKFMGVSSGFGNILDCVMQSVCVCVCEYVPVWCGMCVWGGGGNDKSSREIAVCG